jgi:hypothetical protein
MALDAGPRLGGFAQTWCFHNASNGSMSERAIGFVPAQGTTVVLSLGRPLLGGDVSLYFFHVDGLHLRHQVFKGFGRQSPRILPQ